MTPEFEFIIISKKENTVKFRLKKDTQYLSFEEVFQLWENNSVFIEFYKDQLIKINFPAFYWEHPAINKAFLQHTYECIVERSKPLEYLRINEKAFDNFIHTKEQVVDFRNLGNDARLVIPTKKTDEEIYNHMGKFIRLANKEQIIDLFKRVGQTITEEITKQKYIWLNTAGLGVIWLHIRMDTKPKYYKTLKYKDPDYLKN